MVKTKYTNPVIAGFNPDPSVCRVGKDYYLVTSTFEFFPGVPVYHSRDLRNWKMIGHCLTRKSQLDLEVVKSSGGIYAPTIRFHDGKFYMVTTVLSHGKVRNFFVHTDDPAGEWSEPVWLDQEGIDPNLLFDDDGKVYFTTSENRQSQLDIRTGKRLTDVKTIWKGTGGAWLEAPHLYKINGWYYLMCAEGGTSFGHMETISRSRSPWGPFEPCPHNPIMTNRSTDLPLQATGHADLIQAHDGSWWLVFLAIRTKYPYPFVHNLGRETCLAPVAWTSDGWPVVNGNGQIQLEIEADCLPDHPWPAPPARDDFDAPVIGLEYNHIRNPIEKRYSISKGALNLVGGPETLCDTASPTFAGVRQAHHAFEASALLDFEPKRDGEEAGLAAFIRERNHYEVAIIREKKKRKAAVRLTIGPLSQIVASAPLKKGPATLIVRGTELKYEFLFSQGKAEPKRLAEAPMRHLSTDVAGGFTGVHIGMYATGNGRASKAPARFGWFEYGPAKA